MDVTLGHITANYNRMLTLSGTHSGVPLTMGGGADNVLFTIGGASNHTIGGITVANGAGNTAAYQGAWFNTSSATALDNIYFLIVPEPSTWFLLDTGVTLLAILRRRK